MTPLWVHWAARAAGTILLATYVIAPLAKSDPTWRHVTRLSARLAAWWQRQRNTLRVKAARRIIAHDGRLLAGIRLLRSINPGRGVCRCCGEEHALTLDGRLRRHGCLFGDKELPARVEAMT